MQQLPFDAGGDAGQAAADLAVTKTEFARLYGCDEAYIRRLAKQQRLALTADGRRVLVEASLRELERSRDLTKSGVRERWAAYRRAAGLAEPSEQPVPTTMAQAAPAASQPPPLPPPAAAAPITGRAMPAPEPSAYHQAQTQLTQATAALRALELRQKAGELAELAPIVAALRTIMVAARTAMLGEPDRLAAQLALESDVVRCHALLLAEREHAIATLQRELEALARAAGGGAQPAAAGLQ